MTSKRLLLIPLVIIVVHATNLADLAFSEEYYTPQELSMKLYSDGVVDVKYKMDLDPTLISVNVTLFGSYYENMLITDQDDILLTYELLDEHVKIDTFGSRSITIEYTTSDLTSKKGSLWLFDLDVPVNVSIQLPRHATIIGLTPTPIGISIIEDKVSLVMPSGVFEVSYVLGIVGTREHAFALLNEAESIVGEVSAGGIDVSDAETILIQAREAYDEGLYVQAEQYAELAIDSALEKSALAQEALNILDSAASEIDAAVNSGRTSMLDEAKNDLITAQTAYDSGDYSTAMELAEKALESAQKSEKPSSNLTIYLVAALGILLAIALIYLFRKPPKKGEIEEVSQFDLQKLFSQHPHLRLDEKEVIKYIAKAKSGVFVSELRKYFDMPKSSTWRMIRRLEGEEIIMTSSIGRETFVKIHPKHGLSDAQMVEPEFQMVPAGSYY